VKGAGAGVDEGEEAHEDGTGDWGLGTGHGRSLA
jgi:hypothetical protein